MHPSVLKCFHSRVRLEDVNVTTSAVLPSVLLQPHHTSLSAMTPARNLLDPKPFSAVQSNRALCKLRDFLLPSATLHFYCLYNSNSEEKTSTASNMYVRVINLLNSSRKK